MVQSNDCSTVRKDESSNKKISFLNKHSLKETEKYTFTKVTKIKDSMIWEGMKTLNWNFYVLKFLLKGQFDDGGSYL